MKTSADSTTETIGWNITGIEHFCLKFTAEGQTASEIGFVLGLKMDVIEKHLQSAQNKLGAQNRMHAVVIALRHNIL